MAIGPGVRLGPYEVIALIGEGGMGQVYRAKDSHLKRTVAIKVLPEAVATDAERLARFQREAEILASLNHPNIAQIHGLEKSDGRTALVMELVEGPTLADRIAQGPIPIEDALPIAKQIAEAAEAAHEQGIIHRDLKPANVKVRPDGTVKVLDFGIARTSAADSASVTSDNASQTPTVTTPPHLRQGSGGEPHLRQGSGGQAITGINAIMGTAAYMSPEQARGRPIDTRTDIWSFGCVLYEMLTGRPAFVGVDVSDVLASVLAREPDFTTLPATTPPSIRRLLRRCLQKDRKERLRDIGDARIEIRDALAKTDAHETTVPPPATDRRGGKRVALLSALALLALNVVVVSVWLFRPTPPPAESRLEITTPPTTVPESIAISPDGRSIVFVAADEKHSRLWLRSLETGAVRPLPGTDGARFPFWKPDSRAVGFFANSRLKRIDIDGGAVQPLCYLYRGTGGAWSRDGVILASSLGDPIVRISEGGGNPTPVPGLFQQGSNFSPAFLPDGRRFLYYVRGTSDARGVYVGQLDGALEPRRLFDSDTGAIYASSGHLLFVSQRTLFAQPFDPVRLVLTGERFRVGDNAASCECLGLSISDAGSIAYRTVSTSVQRRMVWFDRKGKELGEVGTAARLSTPSLSRDGQRVLGYRTNPTDGNVDIWLMYTALGTSDRLTDHVADDVTPAWSPDDERIVFTSNRKDATHDLYLKSASPSAKEELLLTTPHEKSSSDWSSTGFVLFESRDLKSSDIWAVPVNGDRKAFPVVQSNYDEHRAQFSHDGRWIAYQSDVTGRPEIHIQAFPSASGGRRASSDGGTQVRWRRDGQELFYVALDGRLMAVRIQLPTSTQAPEVGVPQHLFTPPLGGMIQQGDFRHQYTVSADGQRFLINTLTHGATSPITVILNWKPRP